MPPSLWMSPTDNQRRGSSRRRRGRAYIIMLGDIPSMASATLLRRTRTMRQVSGTGSDDDRTDETLRQRENAARQRRSDDDTMLPGLLRMQRGLPICLPLNAG